MPVYVGFRGRRTTNLGMGASPSQIAISCEKARQLFCFVSLQGPAKKRRGALAEMVFAL